MRFFTTALTAFASLVAIASAAPGASDKTSVAVPAAVASATGIPQLSSSTNPITSPLGDKVLKAGDKLEITWLVATSFFLHLFFEMMGIIIIRTSSAEAH